MVTKAVFPSLAGVTRYAEGRRLRFVADTARLNEAKTPAELARVWASLEARGFWTNDERAAVAESALNSLAILAHEGA